MWPAEPDGFCSIFGGGPGFRDPSAARGKGGLRRRAGGTDLFFDGRGIAREKGLAHPLARGPTRGTRRGFGWRRRPGKIRLT